MRRLLSLFIVFVMILSAVLVFSTTVVAQGDCPPARLAVGGQGRVTPGSANRIRNASSTSGAQIGQIPAGELFDVLEGPQCVDGFLWWRVSYQGVEGWTVEGNSSGYFVEPFDADASPAATQPFGAVAAACPAGTAPEPRLVVGMQGRVVGNTPSRVRDIPSTTGDQIAQIDPIDVFTVVMGPFCTDGLNWWLINLNGITGFTAEGQENTYFVELISATATPTVSRTPLPTYTPTFTRTPGPTLTPSITPTASDTPTPTAVPIEAPTHVTWSSDSKWLAVSTRREVLLYSVDNLDVPLRTLNITGPINDILFSPTIPEHLAVADTNRIYLHDVVTDQFIRVIGKMPDRFSLSFSADGTLLTALDPLFSFNLETGETDQIDFVESNDTSALSPDGKFAAALQTGNEGHMSINPLDGGIGIFLRRGSNEDIPTPTSVTFSPDSTKVVTGDDKGNVEMWNFTNRPENSNWADRTAAFIRAENGISQSHIVNALAFSPDGSVIASAESDPQGLIRIFTSDTLQQIHTFGVNTGDTLTTDVAFSPDGKYLAYSADSTVRILETENYTQVAALIRSH